jgi:hypothetical protein
MDTPKSYKNTVQYFLEVYEKIIYCLIVLQFFFQCLMNAENLISS